MKNVFYVDILKARDRFRSIAMQGPHNSWNYFDAYTGFTCPDKYWWSQHEELTLKDEEARRVELMLGPHAETIFKMWIIRKCK